MAGNEKKVFDKDEIEMRLAVVAQTNRSGVAIFAARQALRVLPVYYSENNLVGDKSKGFYPYAVWYCCYLAFINSNTNYITTAAVRAVSAATRARIATTTRAVASAGRARVTASAADAARAASDSAARAASYSGNKFLVDSVLLDLEALEDGGDLLSLPLWSTASSPGFFSDSFSKFEDYFTDQGWVEEIQDTMDLVRGDFDSDSFDKNISVYRERFEALKKQFENTEPEPPENKSTVDTASDSNPKPSIIYQAGTQFTSEIATKQDYLNREPLAKAVSDWLMDDTNKGRITIGLFGEWGLGKTSFVEFLVKKLKQKRWGLLKVENNNSTDKQPLNFIKGTFNAWEYEQTKNIQAGVAQEVVTGLLKGLTSYQKFWLTLRYSFRRHWSQIYRLVLTVFVLIVLGLLASAKLTDGQQILLWGIDLALIAKLLQNQGKKILAHPLAKEFKTYLRLPDFGEHLGTIPVMQEQVKELIKLRLEHSQLDLHAGLFCKNKLENQRFLFVVDDLDRCSHEGIVKTFEAIRLVMDLDNVVVIIAIDQRVALASLALHYQDISKHHQADPIGIARDYLGKVIHLPITLEEPAADDVEKFLRNEWQKISEVKSNKELQDIESIIKPKVINGFIGDSNGQPITNNTTQSNEDSGNSNSDNLENYRSDKPENIKSKPDLPLEKQAENHQETPPEDLQIIESSYQKGLSKQQEKLFIEWVKRLNISNPRRLKRLTNAYALIRHCFVAEDDVEKSQEDQKPYSRLVMLIWLEYVNELNRNQRAQVLEVFKLKDVPELKLEKINADIKQYLTEVRDYVGMENIELIYNQVKNFVLPAIDGVDQVVATPDSMSW